MASLRFSLLLLVATFAGGSAVQADFRTGEAAFKAGNYADAYLQLLGPGHAGDPRAQFLLGRMSDAGLGPVALDPKEAVRWYRLAAAGKYPAAQYELARAYAYGRGVEQDKDRALHWLTQAAELDFTQALVDLAQLYDEGRGVFKDEVRATALLERAAKLGHPDGQYLYAERLATGTGIARDRKRAWEWFKRAADAGHPAALYRLGRMILGSHRGIEESIAAYAWLTLAVQHGDDQVKRDAARDRADLAREMTPGDIAAAMERVRSWKPAPGAAAAKGS